MPYYRISWILVSLSSFILLPVLVATVSPTIKLTYFDIEGVAEPARLALVLSNRDFDDIRVQFTEWKDLKPKMPYGQLPVLSIDDGPLRTQSKALLRYIGSTFSQTLYPQNKLLDIEEAIGVVEDMQQSFRATLAVQKIGFPDDFYDTNEGRAVKCKLREHFLENELPKYMGYLKDMIMKNDGKWLASVDEPTIADCLAVTTLRSFTLGRVDYIPTSCLDIYPDIISYVKRFCSLDQIRERYSTGLC